jgi:hypothetical protein
MNFFIPKLIKIRWCFHFFGSFAYPFQIKLSSSKNTGKLSLIPVCNKTSPQAHTELKLNVLGVHGKLVENLVHLSKRKRWKKIIFLHRSCPNNNRPVFGIKEF